MIDNNNNEYPASRRLVVVSNRLPIEVKREGEKITLKPGSGGLVTALAPVLSNRGGIWIGWPGVTDDVDEIAVRALINNNNKRGGFDFCPLFLTKREVELYYMGFSNEIIWPLFHDLQGLCNFIPEYWEGYQKVNAKFADLIVNSINPTDFVWVHDYQLMLLGEQLRRRNVTTKIGFFLHIPFPPLDIFLKLPWRGEILDALLQYDLLGFQTQRDRRNFIQCARALNRDAMISAIGSLHRCKINSHETRIGVFPISIDYNAFVEKASAEKTAEMAWLMHEKWPKQQLVLSLDRLDYTKGILQRLEAIRHYLTHFPKSRKKISFIQVVVPSRTELPKYQMLKKEIDRLVGEINSQFTTDNWMPICYMYRSLSHTELLALYRTAEIALITPLKDGMNLVTKEYLACDIDFQGALILSEFAGAAAQLYNGAILINPCDIVGVSQAIEQARNLSPSERQRRMKTMRRNIKRYDIFWWTKMFLNAAFELDLRDLPLIEEHIPSQEDRELEVVQFPS